MNLQTSQTLSMGLEQRQNTHHSLLNIEFISNLDQSVYHSAFIWYYSKLICPLCLTKLPLFFILFAVLQFTANALYQNQKIFVHTVHIVYDT